MTITATCACGACSISVSGTPVANAVCHCDNCKRRTGSAFGQSAYFRNEDVVGTAGEMTLYALYNKHRNEDQERFFCTKCGSTLYWRATTYRGFVGIATGCFPPGALGEPTLSASASKRLPWVTIPDSWQVTD